MEVWKDIKDYEGLYQVSNYGNIKSLRRDKNLKPAPNKRGYLIVSLSKNGKRSTIKIHQAVAKAFVENTKQYGEINHIDGEKFDNHYSNLEWTTRSKNMQHAVLYGKRNTKLTGSDVRRIKMGLMLGIRSIELAKMFGVCAMAIADIKSGKCWSQIKLNIV